jgi:thiol-disulfide isomerase/thioredoxin
MSCKQKNIDESIVIKIVLPKLQANKLQGSYLFLYDVGSKTPIDSVLIKGQTSYIYYKADPAFIPHLVVLKYNDTNNNNVYKRPLGFKNPYLAKTINSSFYIDKGLTVIETYYNDDNSTNSFKGSKQNEPLLRNVALSYSVDDSTGRSAIIRQDIYLIEKYSYSLELLHQLFYYKQYFTNDELKKILSYFDKEVQQTPTYKSFEKYFIVSTTFDKAYPTNIKLQDSLNFLTQIGDENASFNLFVFWASWCAPCRKEISKLKAIYSLYKNKGLVISSISIDEDQKSWLTALKQEQMPWKQFIAQDSARNHLDIMYNIKFIPKAYLFDKQKKLIEIFDGGDHDLEAKFHLIFKQFD